MPSPHDNSEIPPEVFLHSFDESPIGIAVVGAKNEWLYVNKELCRMFGYGPNAWPKDRTWRDFTMDQDIDDDQREVNACLQQNGPYGYSMEKRYHHKNPGEWFWAKLVVSVVRDSKGNFKYFVSYIAPTKRPGGATVLWMWALKNRKSVSSAFGSSILFVAWAFDWLSWDRIVSIKKFFGF